MTSVSFEEGVIEGIHQEDVAKDWAARGFSCELWVDPPEQVWENYVHAADELLMPLTGLLQVEFRGEAHKLSAGQEIRIPAGMIHSIRNISHTTVSWLYGYNQS
ncbi:MAG: cupin domain-containing protein [Candidatus Sericytochromatia bacterium]